MEEPQEPGAESKPQSLRGLGLEGQRGIVELELVEGFAQVAVVIRVDGIDPREDHRLGGTVPGERLRSRIRRAGNRISYTALMDGFKASCNVTDLS